jgi:hypothetical protein
MPGPGRFRGAARCGLVLAAMIIMIDAGGWVIELVTGAPAESRSVQLMMTVTAFFGGVCASGIGLLLGETRADGTCVHCGHPFGPHQFTAPGSPLDGGRYYCQHYPGCACTGTWGTIRPDDLKEG